MAKSTYFSDETKIKTVEAARKFNEKYGLKSSQTSGQLGTVYKRAKEYEISDEAAEQISGIRERLFGRIQSAGSRPKAEGDGRTISSVLNAGVSKNYNSAQAAGSGPKAEGDGRTGSNWDGILINRKDARTAAKKTGSTMPAADAALAQTRQGTLNARRAAAMGVNTMPGADAALAELQAEGRRPKAEGDGRTRQAHGNVNYNITGQLLKKPNAAGSMAAQNDARAMPAADPALAELQARNNPSAAGAAAPFTQGSQSGRNQIAADPALAETLSGSGQDAYGIKAVNQQVVQLTQQAEALKQERDNWDLQLAMGNITELPEEYYDVSDKLYRAQTGLKAAQFSADMARRVYQYTNAEPVQPDESIRDGDYRYINGFTNYDSADIDDPEAQQGVVYDYMTAEQVNVYNAIYQNEGRQEAERYLLGIKPQLQELQREAIARKMTELCAEDKFAAAMLALSTVPAYVASAAGFADLAVKKLRQDLTGIPVNTGGLGGANNYIQTVNRAITDNIESDAGKKLYSGAMAMVNRAAVLGLSLAGVPTAPLMALTGASSAANAALTQGATADEALAYGAITGMVNQIIYAAPISALNTQDLNAMKDVLPQVLKNMGLSAASSGTRTLVSAVADEAAELILLADKADIMQRTQQLTLQGLTPEQASRRAWSDWAMETVAQTAGAAAAGGLMNVVQSIPQIRDTVQLRREYQKLGDIPLNDLTRAWAAYYLQREDTPEQVKRMAGELYRMANGDLEGEVTLEALQQFTTYAADSAGAISLEDYDNIIRAARVIRDIGQAGAEQTGGGEAALTAQTAPGQTEQNTAAIKALLLTAGEIEAGDYSPELQAQAAAVTEAIENGQAITPEWSGQFYQAISAEEQDFNTRVLPKIVEQAAGRRPKAEGDEGTAQAAGRRTEAEGDEGTGLQQESRESTIGSRPEAVGDEENDRPQAEGRRPKRTRETIDRRPEAVGGAETITKGAGANAGQIAGQPQQQAGGQDRPGSENGRGGRILAGGLEGPGDRILGSRTGEYQQAKGASLFRLAGSTARVTPQSPAELGVKGGSTVPTMKVLPRDMIADMAAKGSVEFGLLQDITDDAEASGIGVEFFTGRGTLADGGSFDAMIVDDGQGNYRMMIDCGQSTKTPLQHYRHERFHYGMKQNRGRLMEMANEIARNGDTEALRKVMNTYWEKYDKPYGLSEMARSGNGREAWNLVIEEVMADAYAGLNKFGVKAGDLYGDTVRGMVDQDEEIGRRQEAEGRSGREDEEIGRRQQAEGRRGREDEEIGRRPEAEGRRTETGAQRMATALEKDAETKRAKRELKQAMQELAQQAPKDTLNEMLQLARGYQDRNAEAVSALRDTVDMLNTDDANAIYAALSGSGDKTAKWLMKYMENKGAGDLVYDESLGENGFPRDAYMQVWRKEPKGEEEEQEDFLTSRYSVAGPYTAGTENELAWRETLTDEARKTYETLRAIHMEGMQNKATMTVGNVGQEHDAKVDIVRRFMTAQRWNEEIKNRKEFARTAAGLARLLPEDVRIRANINPDGTIDPTELEKAFKMERSFAQRIVDSLPLTVQGNTMELDGKTIQLSRKDRIYVPGGEAYRRELIKLKRDLYDKGQLRKKSLGGMSKDTWGTMGFLAVNGKTGASGDFTTLCPQMFYNKGCWYCYRRAALESGVNNKLTAETVWYTGEILQMRQEDIDRLNRNGGLRIQSFGDWMDQYAPMLADMLSDAEKVGLQVKIITKEPAMVETVALLREQGLGLNLYFNISADYTVERAGEDNGYTTAMNPARPFARLDGEMYWKRALSVEEAAKLREKYPWVNVRIVATNVDEFISGLQNTSVDVVTGYHGKIREMDRISSATGQRMKEVEPLGDSGMPVFARNPRNGQWITEYEGKTKVHKKLAQAIEEAGLQEEYYTKTCCITGRCATCNGKCGKLSREFETKNATNRDGESVGYWAWWKDTMQQVDDGEDGPNVRWSLSDGDDVNDAVEETVLALSGAEDIRYAIGNAKEDEATSEAVLDGKASDDQIDAWLREINAMQESDNEWIAAQERMQAEGRRQQEEGYDSAEDALGQIVAGYDALAIERAANRAGGEELTEEQYADAAARQQSLDDWLYGMNAWEEEDVNRRIQRNLDNAIGAQRFTDEELAAGNADDAADWLNAVVAEENRRQRAEATIAEAAKAGNLPEELTDGKTGGLTEEQILKWAEDRDKRNSLNTEALLKKYRGEGMTLDEALAAAKAEQERARLAALENVPRERMKGGPAMQSLGIRISGPAGSLNMYEGIDTIREQVKQNERMLKDLGRQIRKLHPSQEEETWAALISRGEADIDSLPRHMNSDRVEELADLISAQNASAVDVLARQKAELRARNNELAKERFKGAERANRVKIQRLNLNQPARNMEMMFGEKQGQEIYGSYFRPVRENEAEKIRKYNEMIKPANEFTDGKGKQRALTEAEALITHKVMEAAPAAADLKNLTDEERDRIQAEAERLLRTEEAEEKKYRLRNRKDEEEKDDGKDDGTEEPEQAEKLTFDERRIATAVAQGKIAEEALRTGTYNGEEIDGTIIQEAAKYFRDTYDKMYDALTEMFIAHGEEPPGFVKGYAPHHQPKNANGILSGIVEMVNSGGEIKDLPASIAGRTHTWKPNKRWDPYFLHRSWGQELEFNAVEGFSDYIDHALDIFYHWDDILRLREASKHLRQEFLNEESRNELQGIDDIRQGDYFEKMQFLKAKGRIYANQTLIGREIDAALDAYADSLYKTADNANAVQSSLVMWWDNYTNLLAGKQSATDRGLEQRIGRAEMNALNKAMNTMAGSNVFGSFSSAVNQLSQIPLIQATFKQKNIVKALADICKPNSFSRWAADCDFLVEREGTDMLGISTKTKVDEVLSTPMRAVDMFTAKLIARTAYLEGLENGMTEEEAMQFANDTGERMQGSRAKGSKPNLFGTKEMVPRLLTTFQLEASNSFRYMVNDMPAAIKREYRAAYQAAYDEEYQKKTEAGSDIPTARAAAEAAGRRAGAGKAAPKAAKMFLGYMIGAAAMNAICEALFGVKPAPLDMIGISAEFVAGGYGFTASEGTLRLLDALAGAMGAEGLQEKIQKAENRNFDTMRARNFDGWKLSSAMDAAEYDALKSIPFLSNVAGLVGWTNPMTDTAQNTFVGDAVKGAAQNTKYAVDEFKEGKILPGLRDLWYALTYSGAVKYAGRQARKTTQGAELVAKRGSYSYRGQLQYPLDVNVGNTAQAILFGRSANRQSRDYYAAGATPLSEKNTAMYEKLVEGGMDMYDAYQFVWKYQGIIGDKDEDGETISGTELAKKAEALMTQAGAEAADIYLHMTDGKGENILSEAAYQRYERGKIEETGMSLAEYMIAYGNLSSITGDKGEDGKTISGTSMLNKLRWMEQNLTPEETEAIILIPDAEGQSEFSGTGVKKWKKSGLSCSVTDYVAAYAYSCGLSGTKEEKKKKEEKKEELQSWLVFNRDLSAAEADAIAESVLSK